MEKRPASRDQGKPSTSYIPVHTYNGDDGNKRSLQERFDHLPNEFVAKTRIPGSGDVTDVGIYLS